MEKIEKMSLKWHNDFDLTAFDARQDSSGDSLGGDFGRNWRYPEVGDHRCIDSTGVEG